ncbi:MAG: PTS sugar transporter subunit IIA [Lachnoclostridium sp.]|jgi:mannitol/fructose-specific phosphotransferase system IIA component (Ntr-type)|nr:PTS sugar transporter subunit IIA [Lachnoclostridium sp.]
MLSAFIKENLIKLKVPAKDWEEAVREGGQVLLDAGYILPEYIDAMIESIHEVGPYVVIAKHVAMPHAKSEYGALQEGISIITLETPVNFGSEENDPVKYVFCLSSTNASNHLLLMQGFVDILEQEKFYKLLDEAVSSEQVFRFISKFDKEKGGE